MASNTIAIVALHTLIEHYINNNKRLYEGFIDLNKKMLRFYL